MICLTTPTLWSEQRVCVHLQQHFPMGSVGKMGGTVACDTRQKHIQRYARMPRQETLLARISLLCMHTTTIFTYWQDLPLGHVILLPTMLFLYKNIFCQGQRCVTTRLNFGSNHAFCSLGADLGPFPLQEQVSFGGVCSAHTYSPDTARPSYCSASFCTCDSAAVIPTQWCTASPQEKKGRSSGGAFGDSI